MAIRAAFLLKVAAVVTGTMLGAAALAHGQSRLQYVKIINAFDRWKSKFFNEYCITEQECRRTRGGHDSYSHLEYPNGSLVVPEDTDMYFAYINEDEIIDALITIKPWDCAGGTATRYTQFRVLILSDERGEYFLDEKFADKVESSISKVCPGVVFFQGAGSGHIHGTCGLGDCSMRPVPCHREFSVEYKTGKIHIYDE